MKLGQPNCYSIQGNRLDSLTLVSETELDKAFMKEAASEPGSPHGILHIKDAVIKGEDYLVIALKEPLIVETIHELVVKPPEEDK